MKPPGSVLGIIGGGQLGRMIAIAASRLGYKTHIYDPEKYCPASQVSNYFTCSSYTKKKDLLKFVRSCDVITYEFENIPIEILKELSAITPISPSVEVLSVSQDRYKEKEFINSIGIRLAKYYLISSLEDLEIALNKIGSFGLLKTRRLGYDGKGQFKVSKKNFLKIWKDLREKECVLEEWIDFKCEVSAIVVRNSKKNIQVYDISENKHKNGILRETMVPSSLNKKKLSLVKKTAIKIAEKIDLIGLLAVEMFITKEGEVLVNEIAPRPHNTGHWTIEGCNISQFEKLVRVTMGLPLGSIKRNYDVKMINIIGEEFYKWKKYLSKSNYFLHLYGKERVKDNRKMGHVSVIYPKK